VAPRVEALRDHPEGAVARCAAEVAGHLSGDQEIGEALLRSLGVIIAQATPVLEPLPHDPEAVAELRPDLDDTFAAFAPEWADRVFGAYDALWTHDPPDTRPAPAESQLRVVASSAGLLASENLLSRQFPSGYRGIAGRLQSSRLWLTWTYHRFGADDGTRFDGLVWLDDHWAWFPKPYRVFRALAGSAS